MRRTVPLIAASLCLLAGVAALAMGHPGNGQWRAGEVVLEGVVLAHPWPVLRVRDQGAALGEQWSSVLIVEYGKLGADRAIRRAGVDGHSARLTGTIIERDGRRILELAPRPGAIVDLGPRGTADPRSAPGWTPARGPAITLEGEIVDPKCYHGAMRPGQGEVHRACARVCIAGGIPAGLIAPGPDADDGSASPDRFCLLLDQDGNPLGQRALPWVGRVVRLTGTLETWEDLVAIRLADDAITPIP